MIMKEPHLCHSTLKSWEVPGHWGTGTAGVWPPFTQVVGTHQSSQHTWALQIYWFLSTPMDLEILGKTFYVSINLEASLPAFNLPLDVTWYLACDQNKSVIGLYQEIRPLETYISRKVALFCFPPCRTPPWRNSQRRGHWLKVEKKNEGGTQARKTDKKMPLKVEQNSTFLHPMIYEDSGTGPKESECPEAGTGFYILNKAFSCTYTHQSL